MARAAEEQQGKMSRSFILGLISMVALFAAAFWIYPRIFADPNAATTPVDQPTPPKGQPGDLSSANRPKVKLESRRLIQDKTTDAGVAGDGGTAIVTDAGPTVPFIAEASVLSVRGFVQKGRNGRDWQKLTAGERLSLEDTVRTGRTGEARLAVGEGVEVTVSPRSTFSVQEIQEGASNVRLDVGRVSATVDATKKRALRVGAKGTNAVAETSGGTFGMVSDGFGQIAVATTKGQVKLVANGKSELVEEGAQSVVFKNATPSAPQPVSKSLLLKVADPVRRTTNESVQVIEGKASVGSVVRVGEKVAAINTRGKFRVPVKLKEGSNSIVVAITDPLGRTKKRTLPPIQLDREKPTIDAKVKWGEDG